MNEQGIRKYLIILVGFGMLLACQDAPYRPRYEFNPNGQVWSPDSQQIVYSYVEKDIPLCAYVFDVEIGEQENLASSQCVSGSIYEDYEMPSSWSPTGNWVVYIRPDEDFQGEFQGEPYSVPTTKVELLNTITKETTSIITSRSDPSIVWSHDGKYLLVSGRDLEDYHPFLVMVDVQTGDVERIIPEDYYFDGFGEYLAWSWNNEWLAFGSRHGSLYVFHIPTLQIYPIQTDRLHYRFAWLANGDLASLSCLPDTPFQDCPMDLYQIDIQTQTAPFFIDKVKQNILDVSQDGEQVIYGCEQHVVCIWNMPSDTIQRLEVKIYYYRSYFAELSPDKSKLLIAYGRNWKVADVESGKILYRIEAGNPNFKKYPSPEMSPQTVYLLLAGFCGGALLVIGIFARGVGRIWQKHKRKIKNEEFA